MRLLRQRLSVAPHPSGCSGSTLLRPCTHPRAEFALFYFLFFFNSCPPSFGFNGTIGRDSREMISIARWSKRTKVRENGRAILALVETLSGRTSVFEMAIKFECVSRCARREREFDSNSRECARGLNIAREMHGTKILSYFIFSLYTFALCHSSIR